MPLNPVQFGKDVIDQFGRYLLTTFPIADPRLREQFKEGLSFGLGGKERLAKGPYIYLSRPFVEGPTLKELINDPSLNLHPAIAGIFKFERLYKHQEEALRAVKAGNHVIISTGTGSGKTEGFLLPIIDECLKARDRGETRGPLAILIYPMNALVNDQLERLRKLLAGTRITFGRYTGETPETAENIPRLEESRPYTKEELLKAQKPGYPFPLPWEECFSRKEILERRPLILLTNYSMLEYLLLRHKDIELFLEAPLKFIVLDEIHTHTGSRGSEIACLIRRVRGITGKTRDEVICIGTSATLKSADVVELGNKDGKWEAELKRFAANIFGVPEDKLYLVQESYQERKEKGSFRPPPPDDPQKLFHEILKSVREVQLQDEVSEVSLETIKLAEKLVSLKAPEGGDTLAVLYKLLAQSEIVSFLEKITETPRQLKEIVNEFRKAFPERKRLPDAALEAEILNYLTLGALARLDDEPLLRPKLHYFVQGLQGVYIAWQEDGTPNIFFDQAIKTDYILFELQICRSCGQHYVKEKYSPPFAVDYEGKICGVRILSKNSEDAEILYFTDTIVPGVEEEVFGEKGYLCPYCGAIHDRELSVCLNEKCRRETKLIPIIFFPAPLHRCVSCGAANPERSPVITPVKSAEVSDVMILAQTMLSVMPEPSLRKLIVFADSRQEAAFQAGWMENRSRRHRLRHLVYQILKSEPTKIFSIDSLHEKLIEKATEQKLIPRVRWGQEEEYKRLRWFIVEELASLTRRQMRGSLEQLGLAAILYDGIEPENLTEFTHWLEKLEISSEDLSNLIHALLDIYRIQGILSDPFLQRDWSSQDTEVRKGIINIMEFYCPHVLVFQKEGESKYQKGWITKNGRSAAQVFLSKIFPNLKPELKNQFLEDLWEWLIEKDILVPAEIKKKRAGKIVPVKDGSGYQINYKRIGITHSEGRYVCQSCRLSRSRPTPGNVCPVYRCKGRLIYQHWDENHYDVVQYTKLDFVPLIPREHSAQVPQDDRLKYEREFKKKESAVNCLVATPTLELGVDIGQLEMVLMRNVPPSPSSYVQRSGRAGRRHRIGVVFTYCRNRSHDKYFYRHPEQMISGKILVPAFSMQNEPLIRKHIFSTVLSFLRQKEDTVKLINNIIPPFIWHYFGEKENGKERYRDRPLDVKTPLKEVIRKYQDEIITFLETIFTNTWP
ncbi:MAG: DEAD/DEAH box helicase, partial [Thermotogaceae bacterium]|nr:DEAD/DEAH box helicase [Thermotogaceae bacterium]